MTTTIRFVRLRWRSHALPLVADDRGEGVISAAIAVLVMAFLGVAMWVGLQQIWNTAESNTSDQVEEIGR
jgi:hypothetical protein